VAMTIKDDDIDICGDIMMTVRNQRSGAYTMALYNGQSLT
jgi:hypothetical protein